MIFYISIPLIFQFFIQKAREYDTQLCNYNVVTGNTGRQTKHAETASV